MLNQGSDLRFRDWANNPRSVYFEAETYFAPSAEELLAGDKPGVAIIKGQTVRSGSALACCSCLPVAGAQVTDMNAFRKKLQLENGRVVTFNKCLLATGASVCGIFGVLDSSSVTHAILACRLRTQGPGRL